VKVAIGIPTHNRRHLVELNAASLCTSSLPPGTALIVVDDASTDYDVDFLRSIYPKNAEIRRRPQCSGGASQASRDVMRQLLETDADAVLILDSDLLVSSHFLEASVSLLPATDGFLSLFNTPSHAVVGARGPFVLKKDVGCAGTLWRRDVATRMFDKVPAGSHWDWRFSEFLNNAGIAICVVRDSLVQHVGYSAGENCNLTTGDIGIGFSDSDVRNAYRLAELMLADRQANFRAMQERIDALERRLRRAERWMLLHRAAQAIRRRFGKSPR
jgi:glycosyltransferase involved in cell wall biosynthesis